MTNRLNSRRYELAVFNAGGLDRVQRAVLYGLLGFLRWETGEATLSIARLAAGTGWGRRAIQQARGRLEAAGVLSFPRGRSGGRCESGGVVPTWRIDLPKLEAVGAPDAHIKPENGASRDTDGRSPQLGRAHSATKKGAQGAHDKTREQEQLGEHGPGINLSIVDKVLNEMGAAP